MWGDRPGVGIKKKIMTLSKVKGFKVWPHNTTETSQQNKRKRNYRRLMLTVTNGGKLEKNGKIDDTVTLSDHTH